MLASDLNNERDGLHRNADAAASIDGCVRRVALGQWCLAVAVAITMAIDMLTGGAALPRPGIAALSSHAVPAEVSIDLRDDPTRHAEAALRDIENGRRRFVFREQGDGRLLVRPASAGMLNSAQ